MIALAAAVAAAALAASPPPLTLEAIRARHAGTRSVRAEVVQVKEGRHWARPLVSRIRLAWTPERVEWTTLSPIPSTVVIAGGTLTVLGPDGRPRDLGPAASDPRFGAMVRVVRALLALDLAALERDFVLELGPGEVTATPRPGSGLALFTGIRLRFDERAEIAEVDLATASDRTRLTFEKVERERAPAP